ncbi:MFS transporter [bacterium]|nr:MFS transporter [bacterium]
MIRPTSTVLAPLRNHHYRRLMLSNMLWWQILAMWTVVAGALVLDITNSALAVTLLSFWRRAAQLGVAGFAGPIGDRVGRRHTLILTQGTILAALVAVLALYLAGGLAAWHMGVAAFLIGAAWSIDLPARNALVPDLVGRDLTIDAMLLESFIQGIVASASAFFAGWLLDTLGPQGCFSVLVVVSAVNVALLVVLSRQEIRRTTAVAGQSIWRDLGAGISYIRGHQPILAVTLVSAVLNTWIFPSMSLLPVFARDVLLSGALGLGLLSAGYNAGTFVGLLIANRLRRTLPIGWLFMAGTMVECVALTAFAFSGVYALSWVLIFMAGLGQAGFHTMRNAVLLTETSNEMRGRALSTVGLTQGVGLIGEMQTGLLAERIGAPITAGVQSGGAAILSALIFLWLPAIWRSGRRKAVSLEER